MKSRNIIQLPGIATLLILIFSALFFAYPVSAADTSGSRKLKIAVIPERGDLDFWILLKKGVTKAATDDGNIKIYWLSPSGLGDFKEQELEVDWCIEHKVDAIVISPVHSLRMKKSINKAMHRGIPVIQMVSKVHGNANTGYVHSDNFKGGRLAAEFLQKELKDSGTIVLGMFIKGNSPVNSRIEGFKAQLKESESKLKIGKAIYVGEEHKRGSSKIRVAMYGTDNPNKKKNVNAVVGFNESSSEILFKTLKDLNKLEGLKFVAFNPDPEMIQGIMDGQITAGVAQDPYEIGRIAVNQATMAARGKEIPDETMTDVYLITKENVSDPEIQEVLGLKERNK
ncbi:substrate-binding domain-containing protein [Maridesulfovibrio sp.]|uniref:substrate-binding domain-containing protein n=1 Tax=Maridesulfovibrio sp. TaxID=2795000 RepID=UPI002A18BE86|nr:substrate-binding domain-containing protein [Maridesulfovibrio sp.]